MIRLRPARQRGHFDFGWLDTCHSFSFGAYQDPDHEQFRTLRVINEDRIQPGQGFGTHGHRDMEILTWMLSGSLAHKDSSGRAGTIVPGDAQRMSAGSGIQHSEFNASTKDSAHLLQIWLLPERAGLAPDYEQRHFPESGRRNQLRLVASRGGADGSLHWNQDARLYVTLLDPRAGVKLALAPGRAAWVQVGRGRVELNGILLQAGDGAALEREVSLELKGLEAAEVLIFDLA